MEIAQLIIAIVAVILTLLGGLWGIYTALAKKIEDIEATNSSKLSRIYERMDSNKEQYYDDFLTKEIHKEFKDNFTLVTDQKFLTQIKLFETHLSYVSNELKSIKDMLSKKHI